MKTALRIVLLGGGIYVSAVVLSFLALVAAALASGRSLGTRLTVALLGFAGATLVVFAAAAFAFWRVLAAAPVETGGRIALLAGFLLLEVGTMAFLGFAALVAFNR